MQGLKRDAAGRVLRSVIDQVKESQLKLGYAEETVRLYYLASSMALLCGADRAGRPGADAAAAADADAGELARALKETAELQGTALGRLGIEAVAGNRVCIAVPPEGVRHVFENEPDPAFLSALVGLFQSRHTIGRADIAALFGQFGEYSLTDMPEDAGFDYMARFDDPSIDRYLYCFKDEMGHTIYHRFAEDDYRLRWPD